MLAVACCVSCGKESPEQAAATGCRARYDNLQRWIGVRGRSPETEEEVTKAMGRSEKDPWGNPYQFIVSGGRPSIWSNGPDGEERTPDDISYPPDAD